MTIFIWGLGRFISSSIVSIFIDLTKNPQVIMALILVGRMLAALNTSVIGSGSAFSTAISGSLLTSGFKEINLLFLAAILLLVVL